jgi:hypothetical protein
MQHQPVPASVVARASSLYRIHTLLANEKENKEPLPVAVQQDPIHLPLSRTSHD